MNELIMIGSYFLTILAMFLVFKNLINQHITIKKKLLIILLFIGTLTDYFLYKYLPPAFGAVFNCIYFLFLVKYSFKMNLKETLYYVLFIWILTPILDIIIMNATKIIDTQNVFYNTNFSKIASTLMMLICMYILSKNKKINHLVKKVKKFYDRQNFSSIKFIMLITVYIILDGLCFYNIDKNYIGRFVLLGAISLVFMICLYIYFKYKISILKETNDLLIRNNNYMTNLITEYRILKHNLTNQLLGLKSTANAETKALIDEIIKEYNESYETHCDVTKIPNGLNGIIYEKMAMYKEEKLNIFSLNKIEENLLEKVSLRSYNLLCEAIGVTLDNAMEAAKESSEKIVYLYFNETEKEVKIKITNSYSGELDLEQIGTINYTSKKKGRGLGLFSLIGRKKINIQNQIKNNFFITYITIEKEKQ